MSGLTAFNENSNLALHEDDNSPFNRGNRKQKTHTYNDYSKEKLNDQMGDDFELKTSRNQYKQSASASDKLHLNKDMIK